MLIRRVDFCVFAVFGIHLCCGCVSRSGGIVSLSVCLLSLFVCWFLPACLSVCPPASLFVCVRVFMCVRLCVYVLVLLPLACPLACLSVCLFLLAVCPFVCVSVCMSGCFRLSV